METNIHSNINIKFWEKKLTDKKSVVKKKMSIKREIPVKVVALWWLDQVGKNMVFIEYKWEIIIFDAWLVLPGWEMYWIDYIIPDISYLESKKDNIKWIFFSNAMLERIWAFKHIIDKLGYPPIYGSQITIEFLKKELEKNQYFEELEFNVIDPDADVIKLGFYVIEPFRVNFSIPGALWYAIHTPKWLVVYTWDFKIDFTPVYESTADLAKIARIWKEWVKLLLSDSVNATLAGRTPSEKKIIDEIEDIIKESNERLIFAVYSNIVWRISEIIKFSHKYGKTIFVSGKKLFETIAIARKLGYLEDVPENVIKPISKEIDTLDPSKVVVLATWSQWDDFSALVKIAKWEHTHINIQKWDKLVISSVSTPWNELVVVDMINELVVKWVDIIVNKDLDPNISWHWWQEDLKLMLSLVQPEYFFPVNGELFMRHNHKKIALNLGISEDNVVVTDEGNIVLLYSDEVTVSERKLKLDTVMIDWLGIWHLSGEYVIKSRKIMAEDWVVAFILKVDSKTNELIWNIQIESRWFVYSSEVKKVHTMIVNFVKKRYNQLIKKVWNVKEVLKQIKDELSDFIMKNIWREPMIIPMFVYINRQWVWNQQDAMSAEDALVGMTLEEQGGKEE